MSNSLPQPKTRYLSPLAAEIEAEFGPLRHARGESGPLSATRADALRIALEQAAEELPEALRQIFHRNCTERLKAHFGREYFEISENQFYEAVAAIGQQVAEARSRADNSRINSSR